MTALLVAVLAAAAVVATGVHLFSRRIEARFPPVGDLIDIGPGRIHCVDTPAKGSERACVLLVHGASGNYADLDVALAERLSARGFRVLSVDRPGHGWSDRLGSRHDAASPERQADWIREALEHKGVDEAIVVVHSLAGVMGLAMALNTPGFVRGLVLLAPVSHPWPGGVALYYQVAASPWIGPLFNWLIVPWVASLYLPFGLASVFAPQPTPDNYAERTKLRLLMRPRQFRANAEDVVDIEAHVDRLHRRWREIRVPTTVLTGDKDSVVYAHIHSVGSARDVPGATLQVLEGVGHSPHYSDPEAVVAAIEEIDRRAGEGKERAAAE